MTRLKILSLTAIMFLIIGGFTAWAQDLRSPHPTLDPSLTKDAIHSMRLGVQWLEAHQNDDGHWSIPVLPAITGLAVTSILHSPDQLAGAPMPDSARHGIDFILSQRHPDGSIYFETPGQKGGGLPTYNTAICLMALAATDDPQYVDAIQQGRQWLIDAQYLGDGPYHGGMGYDSVHEREYADLSNTLFVLEALRRTEMAEQPEGEDLNWNAAIEFLENCQHLKQTNDADWVSTAPQEHGGFVYHPEKSQAGSYSPSDEEAVYLRSYGSMSYAGLLSFIHARVDRDDLRVEAAVDWLRRHWTLDENPGMGQEGLYYYYLTMAKALDAYGEETLRLEDGQEVAWRPALVKKLISLQRIDPDTGLGYWMNDNNRWMEGDGNLVTAYALIALEHAAFGMGGQTTPVSD